MVIVQHSNLQSLVPLFATLLLSIGLMWHGNYVLGLAGYVMMMLVLAWRPYWRGTPVLFACPISAIRAVTLRQRTEVSPLVRFEMIVTTLDGSTRSFRPLDRLKHRFDLQRAANALVRAGALVMTPAPGDGHAG